MKNKPVMSQGKPCKSSQHNFVQATDTLHALVYVCSKCGSYKAIGRDHIQHFLDTDLKRLKA